MKEWLDGESTEPFPSPRGLAPHSFWAGLLACHHPSPAPSRVKMSHSGNSAGVVRPTAAGGCAGMSNRFKNGVTGFPFHPLQSRSKEPKTWASIRRTYTGGNSCSGTLFRGQLAVAAGLSYRSVQTDMTDNQPCSLTEDRST